jgi:hypothetical protein
MTSSITRRASLLSLGAALAATTAPASASTAGVKREQDRRSIRAMAGDFRVRFDFRETVSFLPDYALLAPKVSGGHECVRVITDREDFVSLQHLLVVEHEGAPYVIKHWRQDWTFEPQEVLAYAGRSRWTLRRVERAERTGAWSQTVWQTDDSPRYGGVGRWDYSAGGAIWTSGTALRPLARRDAIRHPPYDRYLAINRHALTPAGWAHEQDNAKLGLRDGRLVLFAHEDGINSYARFTDFPVAAADRYWSLTSRYWAGVRAAWDAQIVGGPGVSVAEEPENGSITGARLMRLADAIASGEAKTVQALAEARAAIKNATTA